jgi:hypothetical protein
LDLGALFGQLYHTCFMGCDRRKVAMIWDDFRWRRIKPDWPSYRHPLPCNSENKCVIASLAFSDERRFGEKKLGHGMGGETRGHLKLWP